MKSVEIFYESRRTEYPDQAAEAVERARKKLLGLADASELDYLFLCRLSSEPFSPPLVPEPGKFWIPFSTRREEVFQAQECKYHFPGVLVLTIGPEEPDLAKPAEWSFAYVGAKRFDQTDSDGSQDELLQQALRCLETHIAEPTHKERETKKGIAW